MTNIESVPFLRRGVGSTPAEGGCIMQVVDWIDSQGWSDRPNCVHPVLQKLAVYANDALPVGERQKLLDLTGRLMGTNTGDKEMSVRLAMFVARRVLGVYEEKYPGDDRPRKAIEAAEHWANNSSKNAAAYAASAYAASASSAYAAAAYAASASAAASAYAANASASAASASAASAYAASAVSAASAGFNLLLDTLDEYDRLSGRTQTCRVDLAPVAEMLALASTPSPRKAVAA